MSESKSGANRRSGIRRKSRLKEALAAHVRDEEANLVDRDRSACLSWIRLRDLAVKPASAARPTSREIDHVQNCRSCAAGIRGAQSELEITPQATFDKKLAALKEDRRHSAPWLAYGEKRASDLFRQMHGHDSELERAHTDVWAASHELARALRHCRCTGSREDLDVVLSMLAAAIGAAVNDPLAPWSGSFDASWPIPQLFIEGAAEIDPRSDAEAALLADAYVAVLRVAPIPLKLAMTYGTSTLLERGAGARRTALMIAHRIAESDDEIAHLVLTMLAHTIAPQISTHVDSERWDEIAVAARPRYLALFHGIQDQLDVLSEYLTPTTPWPAIAHVVRTGVCEAVETMLGTEDEVDAMLQLIATRHYLRRAAERLEHVSMNLADFVLDDVLSIVVRRALRQSDRTFLAFELVSGVRLIAPVVQVMTNALEAGNGAIRQGLFAFFTTAVENETLTGGMTLRFAGEQGDWRFEGGASHPLSIFGSHVVKLARHDREIARLIEWTNERLETLDFNAALDSNNVLDSDNVLEEPAEA